MIPMSPIYKLCLRKKVHPASEAALFVQHSSCIYHTLPYTPIDVALQATSCGPLPEPLVPQSHRISTPSKLY